MSFEIRGEEYCKAEPIPSGGSGRKYYHLKCKSSPEKGPLVLCEGTSKLENTAYLSLAASFHEAGIPVPLTLATWDGEMTYAMDYAGNTSLYHALTQARNEGSDRTELIARAMRLLAQMQVRGHEVADWSVCYPVSEFDRQSVTWDLNYFKYCFLKARLEDWDEVALEEDFRRLAHDLMDIPRDVFMHRDFQSRNLLMGADGKMTVIDFQGGRRGPMHYDVASFLWQARAGFTQQERVSGVEAYLEEMGRLRPGTDGEAFRRNLPLFVMLRILQTLGAYGFRGDVQRRSAFLDQIPQALRNLKELLDGHDLSRYPYLVQVLNSLASAKPKEPLTVTVTSFSYKKGLPEDTSGNGGGYVFDCRATNNPGRYEHYRSMTGRDPEVIKFIEDDGELPRLLENAYALVDASVSRYVERGFTSLCVSFGCTGGQHRSVYSAEHMAAHLRDKFPQVRVKLIHREFPA